MFWHGPSAHPAFLLLSSHHRGCFDPYPVPSHLGISHSQFLPSHTLHGAFILLPIHLEPSHAVTVEEVKRCVVQDPAPHGGFPGGSDIKESTCNGRSPGGGHGNPLQYSGLENPMDRGDWQATVRGVTKSQTWRVTKHTHSSPWSRHSRNTSSQKAPDFPRWSSGPVEDFTFQSRWSLPRERRSYMAVSPETKTKAIL